VSDIFDDVREDDEGLTSTRPTLIGIIVAGLLVATCLIALAVTFFTGLIPTLPLAVFVTIEVVTTGVLAFMMLTSRPKVHKVKFAMATMLSFLLVLMNCGVVKLGMDYLGFTSKIQTQAEESILYDVVVLTTASDDISALDGRVMAEVATDPLGPVVREEVLGLTSVTFQPSPTWVNMVESVVDSSVSSMVIPDALMQVLEDADEAAFGQLKIIASFTVKESSVLEHNPTKRSNDAFILYISGIDTYGSISSRARSDVNMLMVVNPSEGRVLLVNTPRDFYVPFRGQDGLKDKLTHAGVYGIGVSLGTLEDLYDIDIDYYLRINFSSVVEVVDALGGIDVDSEFEFSSQGYDFTVGLNHLDGEQALAFSRHRYSFDGGDRTRGLNQQRVIAGIIDRITAPSILAKYDRTLNAVGGSLETSMPRSAMSDLVKRQISSGTAWQIDTISVDGEGALDYTFTYPEQRLYVMVPDEDTVQAAKQAIREALGE